MRGINCFFFKQKTAYEMRISDWSSDVCSSDLLFRSGLRGGQGQAGVRLHPRLRQFRRAHPRAARARDRPGRRARRAWLEHRGVRPALEPDAVRAGAAGGGRRARCPGAVGARSEEHTSELQSLMRISYAVFCLKKKNTQPTNMTETTSTRRT